MCLCVFVFLVSGRGRHAQIMRRCGLEHMCCSNPVPNSDSGQYSPRHLGAQLAFFKPDKTKEHSNDKGQMNEYIGNDNRQRAKDRQGGHQFLN